MGVHHLAFATRDAAATHNFYTESMGFELVKVEVGKTEGGWAKHLFYSTPNNTENLLEECSDAVTCGVTMDDFGAPHFQVEFLYRTDNSGANETTFTYFLCELLDAPNLSHWVLGLCSDLRAKYVTCSGPADPNDPNFVACTPVAPDPTTCLDGVRFNTPTDVIPSCTNLCTEGGSNNYAVFSVTLMGDVPTAVVPAGVTVATKAGQVNDNICLEGPSCGTVTTTTLSSSTSTTSATSTSISMRYRFKAPVSKALADISKNR